MTFVTTQVWPDLAKFRHFGEVFDYFSGDFIVFGRILDLHSQTSFDSGQIVIVVKGQIVNK